VTAGSPADRAGIRKGDVVVGVGGEAAHGLADFYRKVWARGGPGTRVPLDIMREGQARRLEVESINRLDHLKLKSTF
jgi:S1-C subfamily serine protease